MENDEDNFASVANVLRACANLKKYGGRFQTFNLNAYLLLLDSRFFDVVFMVSSTAWTKIEEEYHAYPRPCRRGKYRTFPRQGALHAYIPHRSQNQPKMSDAKQNVS